jgi:hypothetical protein
MNREDSREALMQDLIAHLTAHGSARLHEVKRRHPGVEYYDFYDCFLAARVHVPPIVTGAVRAEQTGALPKGRDVQVVGAPSAAPAQDPLKPSQIGSIAMLAHADQLRAYSLDRGGAVRDPVAFAESVKLRRSILAHLVDEASSLWSAVNLSDLFPLVVDVVKAGNDKAVGECFAMRVSEFDARLGRGEFPDGLTRDELDISGAPAALLKPRPTSCGLASSHSAGPS